MEDDPGIRSGLVDALESEGYAVLAAADGDEGLRLGLTEDPDLILLDIMLPDLDGCQLVHGSRGFVSKDNFRLMNEGTCNGHPLALASGKKAWQLIQLLTDA